MRKPVVSSKVLPNQDKQSERTGPDMADSGGTTVTLVVTPGAVVPPRTPPPSNIPFTGFDLVTALFLSVLLLALGSALQLIPRPVQPTSRRTS